MKRTAKKAIVLIMSLVFTLTCTLNVFAAEPDANNSKIAAQDAAIFEEIGDNGMVVIPNDQLETPTYSGDIGVSTTEPDSTPSGGITACGLNPPTTVWNIASKGSYSFAGSATGSTLYTNYKFTGKSRYEVKVVNNHSKTLKIICRTSGWSSFRTISLSGKSTAYYTVSPSSSSTNWYIQFNAPSSFSGYVK